MPYKNVRAEGLDEVVNAFNQFPLTLNRVSNRWLRNMGDWGALQAQKNILSEGAVDTNELIQGMHYVLGDLQVTIRPSDKADEYAMPLEEGSKPHKAPIDALRGWADRHGIPVGAVWYKIATEGTEPRYVFQRTYEDLIDEVDKEAPRFMDMFLREI